MSARFVLVDAGRELRSRLRDPMALLLWLGIPALVGGLLSLLGGGDAPPQARLLVADRDGSALSGLLAGNRDWGGVILTEPVEEGEGRRRLDEGDASALLVLPEGFQAALLNDEPARLELVTNPAQTILPRVVQESLEILVEGVFYAQRLLGDPIRAAIAADPDAAGPTPEAVAAAAEAIRAGGSRATPLLNPPAFELRTRIEGDEELAGFGLLFLPGIVFMALLFTAQGVSDALWLDRSQGSLRRLAASPRPLVLLLWGRLLAAAALLTAAAAVGLGVGSLYLDVEPGRLPLALAWCAFTGTALVPLFTLIQLLASTARGGGLLTGILMFPLMMVGGSFFPFETMPAWMAELGRFTPNGLAVARLSEILHGTAGAGVLATSALGILLPAAAAFALAARRLPAFARG